MSISFVKSSGQIDLALGFVDEPSPKRCINFLPKQQEIYFVEVKSSSANYLS